MKSICTDNLAYNFPVSIKGIVIIEGKVPLLKNERNEFELPGGKLEIDEQPIECIAREIKEELNLKIHVAEILDSWLYKITKNISVVIVTYGCILAADYSSLTISSEHEELIMAGIDEIDNLNMPNGYKNSIKTWFNKYHSGYERVRIKNNFK